MMKSFEECVNTNNWHLRHWLKENKIFLDTSAALKRAASNALLLSVKKNILEVASLSLENGVDPSYRDEQGENCLHRAAASGNVELVKLLVNKVYLNSVNSRNLTALDIAVKLNHLDTIEILLESGARMPTQNFGQKPKGNTILHIAVKKGTPRLVTLLAQHINVNLYDDSNRTPLHIAVMHNRPEVVQILLDHNAKVDTFDVYDSSPVHEAITGKNIDILKLLLPRGADLNYKRTKNCLSAFQSSLELFDVEVMNLLLDYDPDVRVTLLGGENVLHCAAKSFSIEMVKKLLTAKHLNINEPCASGETALLKLCSILRHDELNFERGVATARLLIEHGAKVDARKRDGTNMLHLAVVTGSAELVKMLLEMNFFDVDEPDPAFSKTAFHLACDELPDEIGLPIARLLIDYSADVKVKTDSRENALHFAAGKGSIELVRMLLGMNVFDVNESDGSGQTVLHKATTVSDRKTISDTGREETVSGIVRLLVEAGANVSAEDRQGNTPMHYEITKSSANFEVFKYLMLVDENLNYALMQDYYDLAMMHQNADVFEYFWNRGVKLSCEKIWLNQMISAGYVRLRWPDESRYKYIRILMIEGADYSGELEKVAERISEDILQKALTLKQEMSKLLEMKICSNYDLTYYNLITNVLNDVLSSLRLEDINEELQSGSYKDLFPNFCVNIESKYLRAANRIIWLKEIQMIVLECCDVTLNFDIMLQINSYM